MVSRSWQGFEGFFFFLLNNHSLVSPVKYRDRDKVRLIRRLKKELMSNYLSFIAVIPNWRVTLRFLEYIKKPGNRHQRFESPPKEFPSRDFELFPFERIANLTACKTHLSYVRQRENKCLIKLQWSEIQIFFPFYFFLFLIRRRIRNRSLFEISVNQRNISSARTSIQRDRFHRWQEKWGKYAKIFR